MMAAINEIFLLPVCHSGLAGIFLEKGFPTSRKRSGLRE
jgi:hypothetical protein